MIFLPDFLCIHERGHQLASNLTHSKRVQAPAAALAHQTKDSAEVVRKDRRTEPGTVDQPSSLEKLLLLRQKLEGPVRVGCRNRVRIDVGAALVDLQKLLGDVLSIEQGSLGFCGVYVAHIKMERLTLWLRLNNTSKTDVAGGRRSSLSSEKVSGCR